MFSAIIYRLGVNPCVDVPEAVSEKLKRQGIVPVAGTLNGHAFRANLVPRKGGGHRLFINAEMRKQAGVGDGETVKIELTPDAGPRAVQLPAELEEALRENDLLDTFRHLTPSDQRIALAHLTEAKKEETMLRRLDLLVRRLAARRKA
jgi:hypothetical protein